MDQAIPRQHPAVVLRSHFNQLRALLAVAMVAIVALTVAVVILATDSDEVASTSSPRATESINYGDSNKVNPSTGYPSAAIRPEAARQPSVSSAGEAKHEASTAAAIGQSSANSATDTKDEASTAAAIGHSGGALAGSPRGMVKDYGKNAATGESSSVPAQPTGSRSDGGPDQGTQFSGQRP
jgi:hypothetical protein